MSYPAHPKSRISFDTDVRAVSEHEWDTTIAIRGTYDGPTDIVAVADYQIVWTSDGESLFETGSATLVTATGQHVHSQWSSSIQPKTPILDTFPRAGLVVHADYSGFDIQKQAMSYEWKGSVRGVGRMAPHKE